MVAHDGISTITCSTTSVETDDLAIAYLYYLDDDDDGFGGNCATAPGDIEVEHVDCCCVSTSDSDLPCVSQTVADVIGSVDCTEEFYCNGDDDCDDGEYCQTAEDDSDCTEIVECGEAASAGYVTMCGCPSDTGEATFYCDENDDGIIDYGELTHTLDPCGAYDCTVAQDEQTGSARTDCTILTVTFSRDSVLMDPVGTYFLYGTDSGEPDSEGASDSDGDGIYDCGADAQAFYLDNDQDNLYAEDVICCAVFPTEGLGDGVGNDDGICDDGEDCGTPCVVDEDSGEDCSGAGLMSMVVYETTLDRTAWEPTGYPATMASPSPILRPH